MGNRPLEAINTQHPDTQVPGTSTQPRPKAKARTSVPDQEQIRVYGVPWADYLNTRLSGPNPSARTESKPKTSEHRKIIPTHKCTYIHKYSVRYDTDNRVDLPLQVCRTST